MIDVMSPPEQQDEARARVEWRALRDLAEDRTPTTRTQSDRERNARFKRYAAIALAASAAILIAVIVMPRGTSAALFSRAIEKFSKFDTLKMEMVRLDGGKVVNGPMEVPGGDRVLNAIDPQGAAFSLHSRKKA